MKVKFPSNSFLMVGVVLGILAVTAVTIVRAPLQGAVTEGAVSPVAVSSASSEESSSVSSQSDDEAWCRFEVVNGIVEQCCRTRYSIYYTCRHYAEDFETLCKQLGLENCKQLTILCKDDPIGHQINSVTIGNSVCLVDAAMHILGCDPPQKMADLICEAKGKQPGCDCAATPGTGPADDFNLCALHYIKYSPFDKQACYGCCDTQAKYHEDLGDPLAGQWKQECRDACDGVDGLSLCPENCREGFADSCDAETCRQPWNTGLCNPNRTCKVLSRTCENPLTNCNNPSQIPPQVTSSAGESMGSSQFSFPAMMSSAATFTCADENDPPTVNFGPCPDGHRQVATCVEPCKEHQPGKIRCQREISCQRIGATAR